MLRNLARPEPQADSGAGERLEALRWQDRKLTVFGASKHRYLTHRVSEAKLSELEQWCGVRLPEAFRRHLAGIGSGAGPYYGLWDPATIRKELDSLCGDYGTETNTSVSPARPFPYSQADAEQVRQRQAAGEKEPWITSTWPIDGCLPICHQGCTYWTVLVVSGECAGCVWDVADYEGFEGLWLPSSRPTGCILKRDELKPLPPLPTPPSFEDWFWGWVERAETDLAI
jgi:hypothetical protein